MNCHVRKVIPILVSLFFVMPGASWLHAQIANDLRAHIDHPFVIGDTTLPPGEYTFHVMQGVENSVMTVTNENDKTTVNFNVRDTQDEHTPAHSEIVFRKYGDTDFLSKIFEGGSKLGAEVTETSRQEAKFVNQHMHPTEQCEEQK
ncbi:MAG: hypothetical protein WAN63_18175 [Candidatus Sulfotelmatobacter sp.]